LDITILSGIVNPPSTYVENGEIKVYDVSKNLIPSFTETILFSYIANSLKCTLTTSSQNAGQLSNYTFSIQTTNPILRGGSILINLPYFNKDSGAPSNRMISLISGTPVLTDINVI